jgi:hypothetical protein
MLRHLAFACLVVAFAVFAFEGCAGWARTLEVGPQDEAPLKFGEFQKSGKGGEILHNYIMMGNPWAARAEDIARLKRSLPPDPWGQDAAEEWEKGNRRAVQKLKLTMPTGPHKWPHVLAKLQEGFAPADIQVFTGKPEVPSEFVVNIR